MSTEFRKISVLLIDPPIAVKRRTTEIPNMGLAYIAASLIEEGCDVRILDLNINRLSKSIVKQIIKKRAYDVFGIGCMIVAYDYVVFLSKVIKKYFPSSLVIAGNSVASSIPEILLKTSSVDIAVIGEGEITVKEIVRKLIKNDYNFSDIDGIYFKKNGEIIKTKNRKPIEDLNTLPFPALHLFSIYKYLEKGKDIFWKGYTFLPIISTRGCPYHCTYCYHAYQGYKVRRHSSDRIIEEIKKLLQNYGNYGNIVISFADDNFTFDKKKVLEFCDALKKNSLNIKWSAASRVNVIDEELIERMKDAGCISLGFGIESGSPTVLKNIKKEISIEQAKNALSLCKKYGIKAFCSFMLGNQGENYKTALETYRFIKEVNIEHSFRFFLPIPFPKTELFNYAKENNLIKDEIKLIKSYRKEDPELIRVNFSDLSDKKLLQLKISLEMLLNKSNHQFIKNYHINKSITIILRKIAYNNIIQKINPRFKRILLNKLYLYLKKINNSP